MVKFQSTPKSYWTGSKHNRAEVKSTVSDLMVQNFASSCTTAEKLNACRSKFLPINVTKSQCLMQVQGHLQLRLN